MQNFVLKTTTSWTRANHFVDGLHLQKCQIRLFPHPLNDWHDHWTFVGKEGMGDFTDKFVLEDFFLNLYGVKIFFPHI